MESDTEKFTRSTPRSIYQALLTPDSIRLLKIEHNAKGLPCYLSVHSVVPKNRSFQRYNALSYVWGTPRDTKMIYINEAPAMVRSNLYSALLEISHDNIQSFLWIDAICIDQENIKERNAQVALMRDIFANATQVIIWSGASTDGNTDLSVDFDVYSCIIESRWLQRCWTLQELLLGREVVVRSGVNRVFWDNLGFYNDSDEVYSFWSKSSQHGPCLGSRNSEPSKNNIPTAG